MNKLSKILLLSIVIVILAIVISYNALSDTDFENFLIYFFVFMIIASITGLVLFFIWWIYRRWGKKALVDFPQDKFILTRMASTPTQTQIGFVMSDQRILVSGPSKEGYINIPYTELYDYGYDKYYLHLHAHGLDYPISIAIMGHKEVLRILNKYATIEPREPFIKVKDDSP